MPRDPVFGVVYGPSGIGKTTDLGYAFPHAAWIAAPGATASVESVCGYALARQPVDVNDLNVITTMLAAMATEAGQKTAAAIDAIVIDDLTLYVDRTVRSLSSRAVTSSGAPDGRALWGLVRLALLNLRDTARRAKKHVFMNAHEGPPRMVNGARIRGGPALPGAGAELVPAACDLVLRAVPNPNIAVGWKVEYRCTVEDQDYVSKDRHNVTPDHAPMNLGEILRAQGFVIRRHPEMAWQEEIVEKVATVLQSKIGDATFTKSALNLAFDEAIKRQGGIGMTRIESDLREKRAVWTQRDAYDRAVLRNAQSAHRRRLY